MIRSNSTLHHRRKKTRSGNGRLLRPQPAGHPAGRAVLYPLSYRRMERRTGFEPATSRVANEVTAIFTTDRERIGGEQAMLLLPLRAPPFGGRASNPLGAVAPSPRSNRHLHHPLSHAPHPQFRDPQVHKPHPFPSNTRTS